MTDWSEVFKSKNARAVWRQLRDSEVPIVSIDDYKNIDETREKLIHDIESNQYMPSIGHGYLGYPKNMGCTRFVPILSKEDMMVYYLLVLSLQNFLVNKIPGVYGGWRSVPDSYKKNTEIDTIDPYFDNSFSRKSWFKNWTNFSQLLVDTISRKDVGNYVMTTDIANFYDTIDLNRLCSDISFKANDHDEIVTLLKVLLAFWDRRIKGYNQSSQGIPQEIISDASRILANFYIKSFDEIFKAYCDRNDIIYIRWADDIIIFGKSNIQLENAVHKASRCLLNLGLNLNASKTRQFSKSEFRKYRATDVLSAISENNNVKFQRELRKIYSFSRSNECRIDTVYRASIGYMYNNTKARTIFARNFIEEESKVYTQLGNLGFQNFFKRALMSNDAKVLLKHDLELLLRYPYAAPRAQFTKFLRKYNKQLEKIGVSKQIQIGMLKKIGSNHAGSEIVAKICVPSALAAIK